MAMRIRTIKPEFWRNRKLASLGREIHDLAARLITACDDEGFCEADPALLAGDLYPFDTDAQRFVKKALPELERIGFIIIRGGEFGVVCLPKFRENQRINRPSPSRLKPRFEASAHAFLQPPEIKQFSESSLSTHGALTEASVSPHGALSEPSSTEVEREVEREQGKGTGIMDSPGKPATLMPGPEDLAHVWNKSTSPPLPQVTLPLGKTRRKAFGEALERRALPVWKQVFERINASAFCRGSSDSSWVADVDWATRPEGKKPEPATKVLEGAYDRNGNGRSSPSPNTGIMERPVAACAVCDTGSVGVFASIVVCGTHLAAAQLEAERIEPDKPWAVDLTAWAEAQQAGAKSLRSNTNEARTR